MRTVTLKEIWLSFICVQRIGQCVNTLAITALKRKRTWREITTPYVITFPITLAFQIFFLNHQVLLENN